MFFLSFETRPKPAHPAYDEVGGAVAALFVNEVVQDAAEAAAREFMDDAGWDVGELDQAYAVELDAFPPGHRSRARFEQALKDGIAVTYHAWPVGATEGHDLADDDGGV
jgi:hypothetical protein